MRTIGCVAMVVLLAGCSGKGPKVRSSCFPAEGALTLDGASSTLRGCAYNPFTARPELSLVAQGFYVTVKFPSLAAMQAGAGAISSGGVSVTLEDASGATYVARSGTVRVALDAPAPRSAGSYARAAVTLSDVRLGEAQKPRKQAEKALSGSGGLGLAVTAVAERCDDVSGGAACTQVAACDGGCLCTNAVCRNGRCCKLEGVSCGTAGGGADCCSGYCSPAGFCTTPQSDPCSDGGAGPPPDAGTGSTEYICCDNAADKVCVCDERLAGSSCNRSPGRVSRCSYNCCERLPAAEGRRGTCQCIQLPAGSSCASCTGCTRVSSCSA